MAPTIPACDGRTLAEGFTYKLARPAPRRDRRLPCERARSAGLVHDRTPTSRTSRSEARRRGSRRPGRRAATATSTSTGSRSTTSRPRPFPRVDVGADEYFVLGDNRSFSQDSRDFGAVPRDAIFGRVFMVFWPLRRLRVARSSAPRGPAARRGPLRLSRPVRAGVAAGHPATAEVGAEILADGGTAADAVVAMALASCVAETVMSGLLAGLPRDLVRRLARREPRRLRGRAGGRGRARRGPGRVRRRDGRLRARAGVLRGARAPGRARRALGAPRAAALEAPRRARARARAHGRAAAGDARAVARDARATSSRASAALDLFVRDGTDAPRGRGRCSSPGSSTALEMLADEGARTAYRGSLAEALLAVDGVVLSEDDLRGLLGHAGAIAAVVDFHGTARRDARRALRRPRAPPAPPAPCGPVGDGARPRARRRARDRRRRRRAHDEHGRRRRRTAGPASSPTPSASAPASGSPASTCS